MFYRRNRRPDRFLVAKMVLFAVGAVLALTGMITEMDLLIAAAAIVLLAGFALRFASPEADENADDGS